ncbi:MAG: hypothetical protein WA139_01370 [Candidatus Aenigmatarchaeota archaeon]
MKTKSPKDVFDGNMYYPTINLSNYFSGVISDFLGGYKTEYGRRKNTA